MGLDTYSLSLKVLTQPTPYVMNMRSEVFMHRGCERTLVKQHRCA